jgi:hypothetical protein
MQWWKALRCSTSSKRKAAYNVGNAQACSLAVLSCKAQTSHNHITLTQDTNNCKAGAQDCCHMPPSRVTQTR